MTFIAAVGDAQVTEAREAGMQAAYKALNSLGTVLPSFCLVIVPYRYDPQQVIGGITSMISNVPLIGLSVSSGLTQLGLHSHSVIVVLFAGEALQAEMHWFPSHFQSSAETAKSISELLGGVKRRVENMIVFGDGLKADTEQFCAELPEGLSVFGGLSSGDGLGNGSFQISGLQSGPGSLAAAFLSGNFKLGIGWGHGWHPVGNRLNVTSSRVFNLQTLDKKLVSEVYAHFFGQNARAWTASPLNSLSRIYPLGIEQTETEELLVRAPIRIDADGSMCMNSALRESSRGFLMVGSSSDCYESVVKACQQALKELGEARPVFALVLVDIAWQMLMEAQPGIEIQALQEVLGVDVPIAGGYTIGQIIPPGRADGRARFLNQHAVVAIFGDMTEKKSPT